MIQNTRKGIVGLTFSINVREYNNVIKQNSGFTLIELMIVLAIIVILVSIAYPSYRGYLVKTRRSDAMAVLQQFANAMERYHMTNNDYVGARSGGVGTAPLAAVFPSQAPLDGNTKYYNLTIQAATVDTYTLRATPIVGAAQDGNGMIELDSNGAQRWDENNTPGTWEAEENDWNPG